MTSRTTGGGPATRALLAALEETAPQSNTPQMRLLVDKLVEKALAGDLPSIKEVFDRLDGKAPSAAAAAATDEPQKVIFQWKTDE